MVSLTRLLTNGCQEKFTGVQYNKYMFINAGNCCLSRNIVCTVNLGCKLDLKKIALHARNAEYNPKRFAAVIMRIRDPRTTALIFSSGKMVCTGAKRFVNSFNIKNSYATCLQPFATCILSSELSGLHKLKLVSFKPCLTERIFKSVSAVISYNYHSCKKCTCKQINAAEQN